MNPITKHFLEDKPMGDFELAAQNALSNAYLELGRYWEKFERTGSGDSIQGKALLKKYQALDLASSRDEDVTLILIYYLMKLEQRFNSIMQFEQSLGKALSLVTQNANRSVALSIASFSTILLLKKGKIDDVRELLIKIPFDTAEFTKRDTLNCLDIVYQVSLLGLLFHIEEFVSKVDRLDGGKFKGDIYLYKYLDALSRGDLKIIDTFGKLMVTIKPNYQKNNLTLPKFLIEEMKGNWDVEIFRKDNYKMSVFEKVFLFIHQGKVKDASLFLKKELSRIGISRLYVYQEHLLLVELCNRNIAASEKLLAWLTDFEPFNFLINFYRMCLWILKGDLKKAELSYREAVRKSNQQRTQGLLTFYLNVIPLLTKNILLGFNGGGYQINKDISIGSSKNLSSQDFSHKIIGESKFLLEVKKHIETFADAKMPVLILGETGVGKDLVANALHQSSKRAKQPFISINCGALNDSLLQSELFGHEKGTFTGATESHKGIFEEAGAGTVFLDEFGETSLNLQVALLRVIENREVRPLGRAKSIPVKCRILLATNADLLHKIKAKVFREDLYYRINQLVIEIPPLRDRIEDILPLAKHFFNLNANRQQDLSLTDDLINALEIFRWPGNIRQLKSHIEIMRMFGSEKRDYSLADFKKVVKQNSVTSLKSKSESNKSVQKPSVDLEKNDLERMTQIQEKRVSRLRKDKFDRIERIKKLFQSLERIYRVDLIEAFEIAPATATSDLKYLEKINFIKKIKPTAAPRSHYFTLK